VRSPTSCTSVTSLSPKVIEGGDLDVDFSLHGVNGEVISSELRQGDGMHTIDSNREGNIEFCFGNTFSRVTRKIIFVDIGVNRDSEESWTTFDEIDESVDSDFKPVVESVHKVSSGMERVQRDQDLIRGREARHRHTVESNEFRVPMWSIVNCLVMILATGFQVFFVKRLFMDDGKVRT
jgi:hypothetical protein